MPLHYLSTKPMLLRTLYSTASFFRSHDVRTAYYYLRSSRNTSYILLQQSVSSLRHTIAAVSASQEVPNMLSRINLDKQEELFLVCKHFLQLTNVDVVRIMAGEGADRFCSVHSAFVHYLSIENYGPLFFIVVCIL